LFGAWDLGFGILKQTTDESRKKPATAKEAFPEFREKGKNTCTG
jgi:hypothetical protein